MGIFDLFRKRPAEAKTKDMQDTLAAVKERARQEYVARKDYAYNIRPNEYKSYSELLALTDKLKVAYILDTVYTIDKLAKAGGRQYAVESEKQDAEIGEVFVRHVLMSKLSLDDDDLSQLYAGFSGSRKYAGGGIFHWPLGPFVTQIERNTKGKAASERVKSMLKELKDTLISEQSPYNQGDKTKFVEKIAALLFEFNNQANTVRPVYFLGKGVFAQYANDTLNHLEGKQQAYWFQLMALTQKASGGKPSKKFLDAGMAIIGQMGMEVFKKLANEWFTFIIKLTESKEEHSHHYGDRVYTYATYEFLDQVDMDQLKGVVWLCCHLGDSPTLVTIAALAERCYKKIPGKGPAAASIGNACFYTLAHTNGLEGIGHLSRLKLKVKQSNTEALIDKYLQEAAKEHTVSVQEIEDMAVDDFGLIEGRKEYVFDDYKAVLAVTGIGKTECSWYKPDGKPQKNAPAFMKEKYAAGLKEIKDTAKQAEVNLTSQRDRIDRMFKSRHRLNGEKFNAYYFSHGLLSYLAKRLIWNIETGGTVVPGFYFEGRWINFKGETVPVEFVPETQFSLWHPVESSIEAVTAWREFFLERAIAQPLKQAFREVYLLTDAEVNTLVYSNRMAAHILKQHQFNSLAKTRGWKYSLLGAYDDGRNNEAASIVLPDYELRAEYWINEVNADNAINDTGIWLYVATDQVRFLRSNSDEVVELAAVPAIAFSEVMRDVDLFVGVASVGNDPAWSDNGGLPAYRDYWQGYSFGELTEVAKTRKQLLERLLPRLKIAKIAEIKGKFLVVKGKLRTYKIHLGSTNILMEPNDQYLCIVPDRSQKGGAENVFLPFEGDNGLSIIISKAFLLAEDDKITDATITRQIKYEK